MTRATLPIAVVVCCALGALTGHASLLQTRPGGPASAATAVLSGRVFRAEAAGRPAVARAVVSVGLGEGSGDRQTVTDDQGRFTVDGLPAGRYLVTVSKVGWVTTFYGSPRPGRPPGVRIAIADGARVGVEVPLVPGGVIAGRIIDQEGRPMAREWPWLLEQRLVGSRRLLARTRFPYSVGAFERSTDDGGEFRLFGLEPGTYYLVLNPSITAGARFTTQDEVRWALQPPGAAAAPPPPQGAVAGYASIYFPGTTDPSQAQPIVVGPGEVHEGLTFRVSYVPVARVEGVIRRTDGTPAAGTRVSLDARVPQAALEGSSRGATADPNGRFVVQNVPPGDYRLTARSSPVPSAPARVVEGAPPPVARPAAAASAATLMWGQADVVISGQDIQGLNITLAPAAEITGRLSFAATTLQPPADLSTIRLQFIATEALATAQVGGGSGLTTYNAIVQADGAFRVPGLPPDRYSVSATWPGMRTGDGTTGWWITSVAVGGKDIGDAPFEVRANEDISGVAIGFRDRIGVIEGLLTDAAGRPAPEYFVLAFPTDRASWTTTSRRAVPAVRPGTDGRFRLIGLPAGEYFIAVVTSVNAEEAMDPAFLEPILPSAIKVTVREGEVLRQDLKIGGR
jgi:hypothetical protein